MFSTVYKLPAIKIRLYQLTEHDIEHDEEVLTSTDANAESQVLRQIKPSDN